MKVDKGFELLYMNLSYRRKFIRTIWVFIVGLIVVFCLLITEFPIVPVICFTVLICITGSIQLVYNYVKWKKEEQNLTDEDMQIKVKTDGKTDSKWQQSF